MGCALHCSGDVPRPGHPCKPEQAGEERLPFPAMVQCGMWSAEQRMSLGGLSSPQCALLGAGGGSSLAKQHSAHHSFDLILSWGGEAAVTQHCRI